MLGLMACLQMVAEMVLHDDRCADQKELARKAH